jgi:lipid-A-disaccharide synthase
MSDVAAGAPSIYLIAGEPSGDLIGAGLMAALKDATGGAVRFAGVGGEHMAGHGLRSLFPMAELSVMGLVEVLPRVPRLLRRIRQTARDIRERAPDAVVTIDAPGFSFRVARRLAGRGIPLIHYVAPTVWAWRPGRAAKIARFLDHVLAVLPFEPPYFEAVGLPCTFVGHPIVAESATGDGLRFRADHHIPADAPVLGVLPGSRHSEVSRLLAPFGDAVALLRERLPDLRVVTVTVGAVAADVEAATRDWRAPVTVVRDVSARADAFNACDAAIAASGTVAVELAVAGTPMVIGYRMAPLTMAIARALVRVPYVNVMNLTLGREAIPEFIQEACTAEALAEQAEKLLVDPAARDAQIEAIGTALGALGQGGRSPSRRAAQVVLDVISQGPRHGARPATGGERKS